jgi:hypothetical protein
MKKQNLRSLFLMLVLSIALLLQGCGVTQIAQLGQIAFSSPVVLGSGILADNIISEKKVGDNIPPTINTWRSPGMKNEKITKVNLFVSGEGVPDEIKKEIFEFSKRGLENNNIQISNNTVWKIQMVLREGKKGDQVNLIITKNDQKMIEGIFMYEGTVHTNIIASDTSNYILKNLPYYNQEIAAQ